MEINLQSCTLVVFFGFSDLLVFFTGPVHSIADLITFELFAVSLKLILVLSLIKDC